MLFKFSRLQTVSVLVFLLALLLPAWMAEATTRVTLKNGTVVEGEIVREGDAFLIIVVRNGSLETQEFIRKQDISEIVREVQPEAVTDPSQGTPNITERPATTTNDEVVIPEGATRIAFITLEDMVGPYMNRDGLKQSVDMLKALPEETRPEIVVLRINSGGGALSELRQLVPYIRDEVEPNFRTVAWIESAISAACMTAWVVDELYMMEHANLGANTAFRQMPGGNVAMAGAELEELLYWMEQVSLWGKRDYKVMRAMQIQETLTADIDEEGRVTWYLDDTGEHLVSPGQEVLTVTAYEAEKFGISQGIADTKNELATALGCDEWVEVGQEAAQAMVDFRENLREAALDITRLNDEMQIALGQSRQGGMIERRRALNRAYSRFKSLRSIVLNNPAILDYSVIVIPRVVGQYGMLINQDFFDFMEEMFEREFREVR